MKPCQRAGGSNDIECIMRLLSSLAAMGYYKLVFNLCDYLLDYLHKAYLYFIVFEELKCLVFSEWFMQHVYSTINFEVVLHVVHMDIHARNGMKKVKQPAHTTTYTLKENNQSI